MLAHTRKCRRSSHSSWSGPSSQGSTTTDSGTAEALGVDLELDHHRGAVEPGRCSVGTSGPGSSSAASSTTRRGVPGPGIGCGLGGSHHHTPPEHRGTGVGGHRRDGIVHRPADAARCSPSPLVLRCHTPAARWSRVATPRFRVARHGTSTRNRHARHPHSCPHPPADPELVGRIAEILLSADDDPGVAEAAWLVRVEPVAEPAAAEADDHAGASTSSEAAVLSGLDLGLVALDAASGHPADLLRGFVAPPEWWAIGVIASGRAHAVPPDLVGPEPDVPGVATGPASEPGPVRLVHLVTRNGHSALALRYRRTGAVTVHHSTEPVPGDLADVCRRTLGLATAPAEHPVGLFWDYWWLESLMQEAMLSPQDLTWTHAAALHPLADELPEGDEPRHIRRLVEHRAGTPAGRRCAPPWLRATERCWPTAPAARPTSPPGTTRAPSAGGARGPAPSGVGCRHPGSAGVGPRPGRRARRLVPRVDLTFLVIS